MRKQISLHAHGIPRMIRSRNIAVYYMTQRSGLEAPCYVERKLIEFFHASKTYTFFTSKLLWGIRGETPFLSR
ncbi:MAG TPA: hypothetical protein VGQ08_18555 [Nitrospiraceae bacterium]|jgi:hypothetical protein|nr:hypothetical protein [Nitrospiraceae bacterium]